MPAYSVGPTQNAFNTSGYRLYTGMSNWPPDNSSRLNYWNVSSTMSAGKDNGKARVKWKKMDELDHTLN